MNTDHLYLVFILFCPFVKLLNVLNLLTCAFCTDNEMKQKWWLETTFNKNNKDLYFLEKMNFSFVFHLG